MKFVGGVSSDVGVQNERLCVRCHRGEDFNSGINSLLVPVWLVPELRLATAEKFYLKFFRKCFVVVAAEEVHHRREILSR